MRTYRAVLHLQGSYITPFHADTLFGHLCWALHASAGPEAVTALLFQYRDRQPPFVLSNGFPGHLLPRPLIPATADSGPRSKAQRLADSRQGKRLRRLEFVALPEFLALARGERPSLAAESPARRVVTWHNQVDRLAETAGGEGGALYSLDEEFVDGGQVSVYIKTDAAWLARLRDLLVMVGQGGFGKRRSVGRGVFTVAALEPVPELDTPPPGTNGFVSLAHFIPAAADPTAGFYTLLTKYGKLGNAYAHLPNPFKRPLIFLRAGAAFYTGDPPRAFYGRLVPGVAPGRPEVCQYGFTPAVPAVLPAC